MTDILTEAWGLLTPEERPEGMYQVTDGGLHCHFADPGLLKLSPPAARDRLIVACEDVLHKLDAAATHTGCGPWVHWFAAGQWRWRQCDRNIDIADTDRLTAACMALEAERGLTASGA